MTDALVNAPNLRILQDIAPGLLLLVGDDISVGFQTSRDLASNMTVDQSKPLAAGTSLIFWLKSEITLKNKATQPSPQSSFAARWVGEEVSADARDRDPSG